PNAITKKNASGKYLEDRLWLMNYLEEQKESYNSNIIVSKFIKRLMANQINPALNNIRTYSGQDTKLTKLLLNNIVKYRNLFYKDLLKSKDISLTKRILIIISPTLYLKIVSLLDRGKKTKK
uniref:hypothetical protein n=1 Tax=Mariniphaga sediminis TaxID=1628158 RepID=UPI003562CFC6